MASHPRFFLLTASLAFASAFLGGRWLKSPAHHTASRLSAAPTADTAPPHQATPDARPAPDAEPDGTNGAFRDPLLLEALSAADLAAAVALIMARENEDQCADTRLLCLVENMPSHRLAELPAVLDAHARNDFVTRHLLTAWAQRDGEAALSWLQSRTGVSDAQLHCGLLGWSRAAPDAALAWLDRQPPSARSGTVQTAVVEAMAEKDPSAAFDLMKSRGWLDRSPSSMIRVLQSWGGTDPTAALQGLREISETLGLRLEKEGTDTMTELRQSKQSYRVLLGALLHGAFQRSPEEASALVARLSPAELANGVDAIQQEVLARKDPGAAIAQVNGLPSHQEVALQGLMRAWIEIDARASLDWAAQIEDVSLRDACREQVSRMLLNQNPELALEAALGISDPTVRHEVTQATFNALAWNPAALARWRAQFPEKN